MAIAIKHSQYTEMEYMKTDENLLQERKQKPPECESCFMRRRYDRSPKSLIGRFWSWHIKFCPGWRKYFLSLSEEEKKALREKYDFHKY